MEDNQKEKVFRERRLAKACEYVTDLWLPVNPTHLLKIKSGLDSDAYQGGMSLLLDDLKQDPALFLFCLKELFKILREHEEINGAKSPVELFEEAGLSTLKEILKAEPQQISKHSLSALTEIQHGRIQEMLTSAATTELLCESTSVDPDLGFTVSIFRQLGLALVAWNYPGVYQEALSEISATENFEQVLSRRLGFSPSLLAVRLSKAWGVPKQITDSLEIIEECDGSSIDADEGQIGNAISALLINLCRVGESLARANNPEKYPRARADWDEARTAIEQRLGSHGLAAIQRRFAEYSTAYVDIAPEIFKAGMVLDPEVRIATMERVAGITEALPRSYANCNARVSDKLRDLYLAIDAHTDIQAALMIWKNEIIPAAGFIGGYVYSVEPATQRLVAHLTFGRPVLRGAKSVTLNHASEIVSLAYRTGSTIVREYIAPEEGTYSAMAGSFGFSQRVGVVYVEVPRHAYIAQPEQYQIHFRSLAQALNDCLRLK